MVRLSGEAILVSLAGLDEHALVEAMRAARRLAAWADSLEFAAIAELDRRRQAQADRHGAWTVEMGRALCDEISAALTLSSTGAAIWLSVALALERLLPRTRQALAEGRIDTARARVICDGVIGVRDEIARRVEHLVLPDAPRLTARQLTARVRKAIIDADPQAYAERRGTAEKGRRVELYDNPDGTMDLAARDLPAEDADAAYNYVNALAAAIKSDGDERPIDAIRADVALDLLRGRRPADLSIRPGKPAPVTPQTAPHREAATSPDGPAGCPSSATSRSAPHGALISPRCRDGASAGEPVSVTASDGSTASSPGGGTALAPGWGGAGPAVAGEPADGGRSAAPAQSSADGSGGGGSGRHEAAVITRVVRARVTELLSQVRDQGGPEAYRRLVADAARRITGALAPLKIRWCHIRAGTAGEVVHGHEGYRPPAAMRRLVQARRATSCDLDHTVPFHRGGPTCPCNLAPLCRGHHLLK